MSYIMPPFFFVNFKDYLEFLEYNLVITTHATFNQPEKIVCRFY